MEEEPVEPTNVDPATDVYHPVPIDHLVADLHHPAHLDPFEATHVQHVSFFYHLSVQLNRPSSQPIQ